MDSWTVFEWELDVQNTLKDVALPVHLLRQVPKSTFLALFFDPFFNIDFLSFFSRFGRVWEANMEPKSMQNRVKIEVANNIYFFIVFFEVERFEC